MEKPFGLFVGPGFVDILARVDAGSVEVPFRVVGPPDDASIEVYLSEGEISRTYPATELLDVLQRAMGTYLKLCRTSRPLIGATARSDADADVRAPRTKPPLSGESCTAEDEGSTSPIERWMRP